MVEVDGSTQYHPPIFHSNSHFSTIYPAVFRPKTIQDPISERISTPDQDFLDLDWYRNYSKKLVIISHGLEGNSKRAYVVGMAKAFFQNGFDVLAWNYRGCSGEMNLTARFYHSGATDDLNTVILHAQNVSQYQTISLIGFSLGGNLTLKYLGEDYPSTKSIHKSVAISVPLDLDSSSYQLSKWQNWAYSKRFLKSLIKKVEEKGKTMEIPNLHRLKSISSLREFDEWITGPLHGFKNAVDYYTQCSSIYFLSRIKTSTLIISALNDPFLSKKCFPENVKGGFVNLLYPTFGGHVGFALFNERELYWSEIQALKFVMGSETDHIRP